MENKRKFKTIPSLSLLLLFQIISYSASVIYHSKKEANHAGFSEFHPPPIVMEFVSLLPTHSSHSSHLYGTNYTEQHIAIQKFCQNLSEKTCTWKDYYSILNYLRESHEKEDELGLFDREKQSLDTIQNKKIQKKWERKCEVISQPSPSQFLDYVESSRPFIIRNFAKEWPAYRKWNLGYLENFLRDVEIFVGASPSGDFVGPEPSDLWERDGEVDFSSESTIFAKPAHFFLSFSQLIQSYRCKVLHRRRNRFHLPIFDEDEKETLESDVSDPLSVDFIPFNNTTLYMEYYPISRLHPQLRGDILNISWANFLFLQMELVWMGGGDDRKTSPLHFDKFENLMIMMSGTKVFKMFEPSQSEYVYGDELSRGGKLVVEQISHPITGKVIDLKFHRRSSEIDRQRTYSTYTMLDLDQLNYTEFPRYQQAKMTTCTIHKGDLLYVPSNWWHDVTSFDDEEGKSIGVSYFFEPYYHLPSGRTKLGYHTVSDYYTHIRENGLHSVDLCDRNDGKICFRENMGEKFEQKRLKSKSKKQKKAAESQSESTKKRRKGKGSQSTKIKSKSSKRRTKSSHNRDF